MDFTKLIARLQKGNRKAQKELYDEFSPSMFSICLRYAKSKEDAEDIFQQAFIKTYVKINQIKEPKALPGWMKSLFVRECLDFYKISHQKQVFSEIDDDQIKGFDMNEAVENLSIEELRREINLLPHKCRMVFNLYVVDGYSHAEIAETMEITKGTSKSQLFEARKRLKNAISQNREYMRV